MVSGYVVIHELLRTDTVLNLWGEGALSVVLAQASPMHTPAQLPMAWRPALRALWRLGLARSKTSKNSSKHVNKLQPGAHHLVFHDVDRLATAGETTEGRRA